MRAASGYFRNKDIPGYTDAVQGSLSINPYFELKISSGSPVYMVKHVLAGGKAIGDIYESITDWHHTGLGCSSIPDRLAIASTQEVILTLSVLSVLLICKMHKFLCPFKPRPA